MCDTAVDAYASAIRFISNLYKTQEMFYIAVDTCIWFDKVQGMCDQIVFKALFMLKYCLDI